MSNELINNRNSQNLIPTYYLFIQITTARALAIIPSNIKEIGSASTTGEFLSSVSTLLFLRLKLFSSNTLPIETPPILYESSLNPSSQNSSMISSSKNSNYDNEFNFNFNYSFPIAMTPQFIEKYKNTPVIVEVWEKIIRLGQDQKLNSIKEEQEQPTTFSIEIYFSE